MKKIFILASALTLSATMYAQKFTQGKYFIGSSSNLTWQSKTAEVEGAKAVSTTDLDLSGGYFVKDNILIKAELGYHPGGVKMSDDGDAETTYNTSYGIGARYYIKDKFFGEASYSIPGEKMSTIGFGGGYVHSLNDFITIEPMVTYDMDSFDGKASSKTLGIRVGLGIYF
jgi:hypothetical protein